MTVSLPVPVRRLAIRRMCTVAVTVGGAIGISSAAVWPKQSSCLAGPFGIGMARPTMAEGHEQEVKPDQTDQEDDSDEINDHLHNLPLRHSISPRAAGRPARFGLLVPARVDGKRGAEEEDFENEGKAPCRRVC